jgi:hypothetical protein
MMVAPQFYFIGGVVVLIGGMALVSRARERKRREAYSEYCLVRGYKYEPQQPDGERRFRDVFESFQKGSKDSWRHTITGQKNGAPFTAFEYVWRAGGGKSRHTERRCGVIWEGEDDSFPKFSLVPEGWFSRLGQLFGMQDIDFADSPEFSNAYRLTGPNESSVRELFTPELRRFFSSTPELRVTGGGRFLIWWFDSTLPSVDKLDEWLEQGDHVRRRFFKA